jgi:hypothetical protein
VARVPVALLGEREAAVLLYLCVQRSELEPDGSRRPAPLRLVEVVRRYWPEVAPGRRLPSERYVNHLGQRLRDAGLLRAVYLDGVLAHATVQPQELPDPRQMELPLQALPRRRATQALFDPAGKERSGGIRSDRTESIQRALFEPAVLPTAPLPPTPGIARTDRVETIESTRSDALVRDQGGEEAGKGGVSGPEQAYSLEERRRWKEEAARRRRQWDKLYLPVEAHRLPLEYCRQTLGGMGETSPVTKKTVGYLYPTEEARERAAGRGPAPAAPENRGAGRARDAELLKEAPAEVNVGELLASLRGKLTPGGPSAAA